MQLIRPSLAASLCALSLQAQDYVSLQHLYYDENRGKIIISAPSLEVNKDFGVDYTLNTTLTYDGVSGASPTYYDSSSGPSSKVRRRDPNSDFGRGSVENPEDIVYDDVDYVDRRINANVMLTSRMASRDELRTGVSYTIEYDLYLYEGSLEYLHYLDSSKNRSLSLGASYQFRANLVPCEGSSHEQCDASSGSSQQIDSNHFNVQSVYSQVLDKRSSLSATLFYIGELGYLSNSYKNVVRYYNTQPIITNERRPDSRHGGGMQLHYANALSDTLTLQGSYRYYRDSWHIEAHTPQLRLFYAATPALLLEAGYRYYYQSGAYFYSGAVDAFTDETYASSDFRLGTFNAFENTLGLRYHLMPELTCNASLSYYKQSTDLDAMYLITGIRYNF